MIKKKFEINVPNFQHFIQCTCWYAGINVSQKRMKVRSNKWILLNSSKLSLFLFSKYIFTRTVLRCKISSKKYCLNFGIYTKLQMGRGVGGLVEYKRNQFSQRFYSIHLFRSHIGVGGRGELCKVMHNHNQRLFFLLGKIFW